MSTYHKGWNKDWMYDDYETYFREDLDANSEKIVELSKEEAEKFIEEIINKEI